MKNAFVVNAEPRQLQGTSASRRLRKTGKVPAILYGGKGDAVQIQLDHNELSKQLALEAFYSKILTVRLEGKDEQAVLKDVHRHPARPLIMHVDLMRVQADKVIRMRVPLHFKGAALAPGVKTGGGILEHLANEVEVECLPKDLPEFIEVDVSGLDVNDSIHLSQLQLAAGITLVDLRLGKDSALAAVHMPRAVVEEEAAAPVEGATAEVPAIAQKAEGAPGAAPAAGDKKDDKKEEKKK